MKEKDEDLLRSLGARGAKRILEFLFEHGTAQHHQMEAFLNTNTLNRRLHDLLILGLIEHHFEKEGRVKNRNKGTEKGKVIIQRLRDVIRIMRES